MRRRSIFGRRPSWVLFPAAAALPGQITVSGTVRYTASDGTLHPARGITVQVWDANGTNSTLLRPVAGPPVTGTDASGQYSATVSSTRADGTPRHLFVRALARSAARSAGSSAFVVRAPGATAAYRVASGVHLASVPAMTIDITGHLALANHTAFGVADALTTGLDYTRRINGGQLFPPLTVSYPDSATETVGTHISIEHARGFEWDTILHEYGHFAADSLGVSNPPETVRWEFQDNLAETRGKGPGILLAWSEGFAYWFSLTAQDVEGVAALAIREAGDLFIDTGTFRGPDRVDIAFNDGLPSLGEDSTLSVARALMAFRLDPGINMSDTQIINALSVARADQLSAAVIALMADASAANFGDFEPVDAARVALSNDFACVLTDQAVAPKITAPPSGTHLISGPPALTYSWKPNGAGSVWPLDQFTVQFWSGNWDTLLFESPQDTATSFTPNPAQLDQIFNALAASGGQPDTVNVVVKGWSTDAPATGPYKSCAITQPVDLDPVVTATPLDPAHPLVPHGVCSWGVGIPLAVSQFTLAGERLQPNTQYDFVLTDPATGVPDTQLVNPPPMSDANGQITLTVTLPEVPAHNWTLRGTPPAGPAVETKLKTGWSACYFFFPDGLGHDGYAWGGDGLKPGTSPSLTWNGAVVSQSLPVVKGAYGSEFPYPQQVPRPPDLTVSIDGVTLDGGSASATFGPVPWTSPLIYGSWAVGG